MSKLISIVVPIYNGEKYLKECLDSVLKQDYSNFELVLIDDGSKDNTLKICQEYASKDKRIKVVHKENGGLSNARNTGMDNATGDYLTFIDADDMIEPNYLSILLSHMEGDVKLVACNYKHLSSSGDIRIHPLGKYKTGKYSYIDLKDKAIDDGTVDISPLTICWNTLFDLHIIKDNNIRFIPGMVLGEDALFTQHYFYVVKGFTYFDFDNSPYIYRDTEGSITHSITLDKINEKDIVEEMIYQELLPLEDKEVIEKQAQRRRVTEFISFVICLSRTKELTYKAFKYLFKKKDIPHAIKYLDLKNTRKDKKFFIYLFKMRLLHITYMLFKMKFRK